MNVDKQSINKMKFSVSMCVYKNDDPNHFQEAIESIINQTVRPNEVVVVVDGPIPDSIENIVKLYEKKEWFKIIRLVNNVGHGNARRIGLENCKYELVALMDADDISLPERFEKQIRCFIRDESLSIVGGIIEEFIDTPSNIISIRDVPEDDKDIKEYLKKRCPLNQVTVMFKASIVKEAGGYIDWYNEEDYYLWVRMFQHGAIFKNLNDTLVYVRVGSEMYSRRGGIRYFKSETRLQKYMLANKIINLKDFVINVSLRFIVQVLLPNKIRGIVFAKFARKNINK